MQFKRNYISYIKQIYFNHKCSLYSFVHYIPKFSGKKEMIKIMKINELEWTLEFQKKQKKEILSTNFYFHLYECFSSYEKSLKSYEQMFDLIIILSNVLVNKQSDFYDLFVKFYELILFDEKTKFYDAKDFKEENIIEYFKKKDNIKYKKIISIIDEVLKKDKFKETENKEIVDKVLKIIKL